jgi:hypothetical protein
MARAIIVLLGAAICPFATAIPQNRSASQPPVPIPLQPQFRPGQVMRYRVAFETTSAIRQSGLVQDPQGAAQLTVTWNATVRLEVLPADGASDPPPSADSSAGAAGAVRLRTGYEQSAATVRSDTPDPRAEEIEQQYARLAGRSLEFTLTSDGRVSDLRGLEGILSDERARSAVQQWMAQLSSAAATPPGGVLPGQTWSTTQPADLPLAGLAWRTDATYLRNEPCRLANPSGASSQTGTTFDRRDCAVILTRLALVTARPLRDPTPEEYRRNGLRTSGRWTGSGESLVYVSLRTGWVVSTTQESAEEMDVAVTGNPTNSGGSVRYSGTTRTRSQVLLLPEEASSR